MRKESGVEIYIHSVREHTSRPGKHGHKRVLEEIGMAGFPKENPAEYYIDQEKISKQ